MVTFNNLTNSIQLNCSLNVTIPSNITVIWTNNSGPVDPNNVMQTDTTTTLLIRNPQPSDAGHYSCTFNKLNLLRFIILSKPLIIIVLHVCMTSLVGPY